MDCLASARKDGRGRKMEQKIMTHHPFERCAPGAFGHNLSIEQRGALEIAAGVRRLEVRL